MWKVKRYVNQEPAKLLNSIKQLRRWQQERKLRRKFKDYSFVIPSSMPNLPFLHHNRIKPTLTWIGHSTFFVQYKGLNIVTDPVWSNQMATQKRLSPPGIALSDMPSIDVVLISHSHYDHLSIGALRRLSGDKMLLVPCGLGNKLRLKGLTNIQELSWWESVEHEGVRFTFVPAQHSTRRNPWDLNRSHWGGWVVEPLSKASQSTSSDAPIQQLPEWISESPRALDNSWFTSPDHNLGEQPTIYFAGDSGYFGGFGQIGERFAIDVALLPIGAYDPEWFMKSQHIAPEEALQAFVDCGASWFVPMHYGAYKLADDTPQEALERLEQERVRRRIPKERIVLPRLGATWQLDGKKISENQY